MPLRALMEERCFGLLENPFPLKPSRAVHIGGRDLEKAEERFLRESGMTACSVQEIRSGRTTAERIAGSLSSGPLYVHLDLDVLDPADFPDTPLPVEDGLRFTEVYGILQAAAATGRLVGAGIYEYAPSGRKNAFLEKLIRFGLAF